MIHDEDVEKIVRNCRKMFRPDVEAPAPAPGQGGRGGGRGGHGGRGPAPVAVAHITARAEERFRQLAFY